MLVSFAQHCGCELSLATCSSGLFIPSAAFYPIYEYTISYLTTLFVYNLRENNWKPLKCPSGVPRDHRISEYARVQL